MLDAAACKTRQKTLLDRLAGSVDAIVLASPANVRRWANFAPDWKQHAALILFSDGRSTLITANAPATTAVCEAAKSYEANTGGTLRNDQPMKLATAIVAELQAQSCKEIAIDTSPATAALACIGSLSVRNIDVKLFELRRTKDADELALIRRACEAVGAMYRRAAEVVQPGVAETHVFAELHAAAVEFLGEPMTAILGNDYACGVGGGAPRAGRVAQAGEIYILDVGPTYRGYFADACRGFAVDRKPTDVQLKCYAALAGVFPLVEAMIKPGVRCRALCDAVDAHLREAGFNAVPHHLGHGVGLFPHEAPHLNRGWDETLAVGDVFSIEPGIYRDDLRGGLRLENLYAITAAGAENLTPFPMQLTVGAA